MTTDAPGVFISYRRKDGSYARLLYDRLVEHLGKARVFMDVAGIRPGQDWTIAISQALAKCGVMLVLIGNQWGQVRSDRPARIGDTDWVRNEIETAFDQGIPIIPVLLQDAVMPSQEDLPDTLVRLSHIQAIRVRHDAFEPDAARLLEAVDQKLRTRSRVGLARRLLVPLLTLICLVAAGFATWTFTTTRTVAEEIAEPIGTAVNPFLEGVGQDVTQTPPPKAAGQVRGDTEGLYGGTRRGTSCDVAKLVAFLQSHPEKGAAWAGVLKLTLQQIPSFVSQLTPLILRADTRVTNHGFEDGHVTSFPSILQAGTAVLVDKQGVPVVKCFCGNPLTPPRRVAHSYQGRAWPGFDAQKVIVIKPAPTPVKSFTVVDHTTGKRFSKKTGAQVAPPGPEQPTTPQSTSLSPSPTPSPADTASPTPSETQSTTDIASPTQSVPPSTDDPTIESESASPTESAATDAPAAGGSGDPGESQGSDGSEQTDGNGSGETQTGTGNRGETDNKAGTDTKPETSNEGDTGTNGGAGTKGDTAGGATSSAGPR
jgi:hypothetical protein